jgi:glycosyltransferase involved in cell wall biosynthesis
MKRILIIASHRTGRAPGQRFRFEQYLDHLSKNGFECELSHIISEQDDKVLYKSGHYFQKAVIAFRSFLKRWKDVRRARQYDIIFIFREAFMIGSTYFERKFKRSGAKIVFDFDDAIWMLDTSNANKRFEWLKDANKTARIIALSDMVFAGNAYLAGYARRFNDNVKIVPTTIDTDEYVRMQVPKDDSICIGWSGSITTIKHFEYAVPFLRRIKQKYGDKVKIKVIGDGGYVNDELGIKGLAWNRQDEIMELSLFDIGIMPLPDDEWAKGKCGLKGLQYMALEVPTIMSPVGVNSDIIDDGANGFLATAEDEWVEKLTRLIESKELREAMGKAARATVLEKYSVYALRDNYVLYLRELLNK